MKPENFQYVTRSIEKALKLFTSLIMGGYQTQLVSCNGHIHLETAATAEEFAVIRASIGIPSSMEAEIDTVVDSVTIPDDLSDLA
jgi:hypothetical protein